MPVSLTVHCDGTIGDRRCLSYAAVRSDPGRWNLDVQVVARALAAGALGYYPDAGDGVNCEDFVAHDDEHPERTRWWRGAHAEGFILCPLH